MGHDLQRAALIACCVLAIVVAAAFFPAAGYGDFPGRDAVSDDHYLESSTGTGDADSTEGDDGDDLETDDQQDDGDDSDGTADGQHDDSDGADDTDGDDQQDDSDDTGDGSDDAGDDDQQDDEGSSTSESGDGLGVSLDHVLAILLMLVFLVPFALLWRATAPTRHPHLSEADIPNGFLPRLQFRLKRIPQVTMAATIGASSVVPTIADALLRTGRGVGGGFGQLGRSIGRGFGRALFAAPAGFASALQGLGGLSLTGGFSALFDGFGSVRRRHRRSSSDSPTAASNSAVQSTESADDPGPQTIEAAWEEMTALVTRSSRGTVSKTPGEYARAAIAAGYPESAVTTLTEVFRQVRYGDYPPTDDRTRRARAAYEELVAAVTDDDGGDDR
ncbi:DUF4129 domain-containing protein [Natrialbaceae archaeon A-CW1-1]